MFTTFSVHTLFSFTQKKPLLSLLPVGFDKCLRFLTIVVFFFCFVYRQSETNRNHYFRNRNHYFISNRNHYFRNRNHYFRNRNHYF